MKTKVRMEMKNIIFFERFQFKHLPASILLEKSSDPHVREFQTPNFEIHYSITLKRRE
jgi:hypothetical protein